MHLCSPHFIGHEKTDEEPTRPCPEGPPPPLGAGMVQARSGHRTARRGPGTKKRANVVRSAYRLGLITCFANPNQRASDESKTPLRLFWRFFFKAGQKFLPYPTARETWLGRTPARESKCVDLFFRRAGPPGPNGRVRSFLGPVAREKGGPG